jgi:hypothetical protein
MKDNVHKQLGEPYVPNAPVIRVAAQKSIYVPVWNVKSARKLVDSYTIIRARPRSDWIQIAEVSISLYACNQRSDYFYSLNRLISGRRDTRPLLALITFTRSKQT